jgi:glutathionylspermidine synthase
VVDLYHQLGIKWQCVEFARRFLLMNRGLWLRSVPVAEQIWSVPHVTDITTGKKIRLMRWANGSRDARPAAGDLLIWQRAHDVPFGHVAAVVSVADTHIQVAEQNEHFHHWQGRNYGRTIPVSCDPRGAYTIIDEDPVLGWMRADGPLLFNFNADDSADAFRHIVSPGSIRRIPVPKDTSLAWLSPQDDPCDFFLKRSLVIGKEIREGAMAKEEDVPGAYYVLDYDMWCRLRNASLSLHEIAMEATWHVVASERSDEPLLATHFGIPRELYGLLRRSMELVPPMFGRFDFGYDGSRVIMLEYNCDSSAALLECMRTQQQWARHYKVDGVGESTGSFLRAKIGRYFQWLSSDPAAALLKPAHSVIHFMIDEDDEERYTALCVMQVAEEYGFKCKLCVKMTDFRFLGESRCDPRRDRAGFLDDVAIVDLDGVEVVLVWKTWSWDTVLRQYAAQGHQHQPPGELQQLDDGRDVSPPPLQPASSRRPTLSDVLLNAKINVLEPLWKAVAGSKALLPIMHRLYPRHANMVPASFSADKAVVSRPYLTKPVNGRAGQNITMHDAHINNTDGAAGSPGEAKTFRVPSAEEISANEDSSGRFLDSLLVYQQRCFLQPFDGSHYPIFCGWVVGEGFGGVVVREDTSKITKLDSVCVPCRVVRQ